MITSLELRNFRSVEHERLDFSAGTVVMRGANEAGKSTRLEAICYALGGARALKQSLAEVVTWGLPEKDLRVSLTMAVQGRSFEFVRHKGGAEVYLDGDAAPYVTGQEDVTKFAAELLGCDMQTATSLMLASQGGLRGALEKKPAEAVAMIEGLADFDLFEVLAERMASELLMGKDTPYRDRLARLEAELEAPGVTKPDHTKDEDHLRAISSLAEAVKKELETAQAAVAEASVRLRNARQDAARRRQAEQAVEDSRVRLSVAESRADGIREALLNMKSEAELKEQLLAGEAAVAAHEKAAAISRIRDEFLSLPKSEDEWEGDVKSLEAEVAQSEAELAELVGAINKAKSDKAAAAARIIRDLNCPTCRRPLDNHADVAASNTAAEADVAEADRQIQSNQLRANEATAYIKTLKSILSVQSVVDRFVYAHGRYVKVDVGVVPNAVVWTEPIVTVADLSATVSNLGAIRTQLETIATSRADLSAVSERVAADRETYEQRQAELAALPEVVGIQELRDAEESANHVATQLRGTLDDYVADEHATKARMTLADQQYRMATELRERLEAEASEVRGQLAELELNNGLHKKLREARPQVANKLWDLVLRSVSSTFSAMRGEQSVVTRGKDGFEVNERPCAGLSGSTLDALGLALRFALIRTFVPNCPFVTLDEPFAACDETRAAAMLAYIKAAAMPQVLIVTHEAQTEDHADQYIEV